MVQRFGGKYSPDNSDDIDDLDTPPAYAGAKVDPVGARANLLFLPAVIMVFMAVFFGGGAIGMSVGLASAAVLALAAWLLRGGLQAEAEFNARRVAHRPALPRKIISSVLTGVGIALAAWRTEPGLVAPLLFGIASVGLHLAAFGLDPLKSKGMEGIDTFQQNRVARVVDEAERHLRAMSDAMLRANDRKMETRLEAFQNKARDLIRTVEEDPRDLTAARKYLGVYLMGARDATIKFADIYSRTQDPQARKDYAALLDDMTSNFDARTKKLLLDDRSDLNIEIDVLRDRLQREGVTLPSTNDS